MEKCGGLPLMHIKIGTLDNWKNFCRLLKESGALNKEELLDEYI